MIHSVNSLPRGAHIICDESVTCEEKSFRWIDHVFVERLPSHLVPPRRNCSLGLRREEGWISGRINTTEAHAAEREPFNQRPHGVLHDSLPLGFQGLCHDHIITCLLHALGRHLRHHSVMNNGTSCELGHNLCLRKLCLVTTWLVHKDHVTNLELPWRATCGARARAKNAVAMCILAIHHVA